MYSSIADIKRTALRRVPRQNFAALGPSIVNLWGGNGLLSGQTVEWVGGAYCGKTGMLRVWIEELYQHGMAIAWIDPSSSMDPNSFANMSESRFWMVRPPSTEEALICLEMIIRAGCFDVVVIEHSTDVQWNCVRRVQRLAKIHQVILVWTHGDLAQPLAGQVAHRIRVQGTPYAHDKRLSEWAALRVKVNALNRKQYQTQPIMTDMYLQGHSVLSECLTTERPDRSARETG